MSTDSNTNTGQNIASTNNNGNTGNKKQYPSTLNSIIRDSTKSVLDKIISKGKPYPEPNEIEEMLMDEINGRIRAENVFRDKGDRLRAQVTITPNTIADILIRLHHAVYIVEDIKKPKYGIVGIYCESGPNKGIYSTDDRSIKNLIYEYRYNITDREITEVFNRLIAHAPIVSMTRDRDLVPVNNGIFHYKTKQLMPFSPSYIFTSKPDIDLDFNATKPVIHNDEDGTDWDVDIWFDEIASHNEEVVNLFWQITGALLRPNVSWNKAVLLFSESGANGKGSLAHLWRNLMGPESWTSIPLSEMGKDFMLEPLIHTTAIIVDENDVGIYIDKAANFKTLVTGDVLLINRKFQTPLSFRWKGLMVQCLNEMPRIRDKSDSFFRRQLIIPFFTSFTGRERKYIRDDYLNRKETLAYILKRVLVDTDYYNFDIPQICKDALEEYKEFADPVRLFAIEVLPNATWDLLPFSFLYDCYKSWYNKANPSGSIQSQITFTKDLKNLVRAGEVKGWKMVDDGNGKIRPGTKMSKAEPLIYEYNLEDWMNPHYKNSGIADMVAKCTPSVYQMHENYRGLIRDTISDTDSDN